MAFVPKNASLGKSNSSRKSKTADLNLDMWKFEVPAKLQVESDNSLSPHLDLPSCGDGTPEHLLYHVAIQFVRRRDERDKELSDSTYGTLNLSHVEAWGRLGHKVFGGVRLLKPCGTKPFLLFGD